MLSDRQEADKMINELDEEYEVLFDAPEVLDPASIDGDFPPLATPEQMAALDDLCKTNPTLSGKDSWLNELPPIATPEQIEALNQFYAEHPKLNGNDPAKYYVGDGLGFGFDADAPWIQTYTSRRFNPTKPNPNAIVIQDGAHALSNLCRYTGHSRKFYSVAQHSVYVSYICNQENALAGLLHDLTEAYIADISSPLKRSGDFVIYRGIEANLQKAICTRFGLTSLEPPDVKRADVILLATEARDLMFPIRPDWIFDVNPLPWYIEPLLPEDAERLFLDRFDELVGIA